MQAFIKKIPHKTNKKRAADPGIFGICRPEERKESGKEGCDSIGIINVIEDKAGNVMVIVHYTCY